MNVALVSLDQVWEDKSANQAQCDQAGDVAHAMGADLLIFPEMTLTGFSMNTARLAEPESTSPSLAFFSGLARRLNLHVAAGVILQCAEKATNNLVCFDRSGERVALYAKAHPFSYAQEDTYFQPGNRACVVEIEGWQAGFTVCYDLRFPEFYAALSRHCDLVVNIANWPARRIDHWNTLLRARAIENQVYMIGVNRTGRDGSGLEYQASSQVIDADGKSLTPVARRGPVEVFSLEKETLVDHRSRFPTRRDARPDFYRTLHKPC